MNLALFVPPSVHLALCSEHKTSELDHHFFLIFCMKLDIQKVTKTTKPDSLKKVPLGKENKKFPKMTRKWSFWSFEINWLEPKLKVIPIIKSAIFQDWIKLWGWFCLFSIVSEEYWISFGYGLILRLFAGVP